MEQISCYVAFCKKVNEANDMKVVESTFKKVPSFSHRSVMNQKPAEFTESKMEMFFTLFEMMTVYIDGQFKIVAGCATADVLATCNDQLKKALGTIAFLKKMSSEITVQSADVSEVAIELRSELLDNISALIKGFFAINAVDRAISMNEVCEKNEEPLKYSPDALAGLAKTAEAQFKICY